MPEKLIPISKRQHDKFNALTQSVKAEQARLQMMAQTLVDSIDDELGEVSVAGARCADGVYSLVITLPDPPAQAETT